MKNWWIIIKSDYLQRTRSYSFLITLCLTIAVAYSFIPSPNSSYATIRIGDYRGEYNSAWIGYVSAVMGTFTIALFGFYLINSGIKKDTDTRVGQIIGASPMSNVQYLFTKMLSNLLILLTIVLVIFFMSIVLFFWYDARFPFQLLDFLVPYVLILVPTMFFIAALAVIFEVTLGRFTFIQNIGFFFLFCMIAVNNPDPYAEPYFDVFGSKLVMQTMTQSIDNGSNHLDGMTIGYVLTNLNTAKKFVFTGVDFPAWFIFSRIGLILSSISLVMVSAPIFHRFNIKERLLRKKKSKPLIASNTNDLELSQLPALTAAYGMFNFFKIEVLMSIRKGPKWLWLLNIGGMVALSLAPIDMAHQMILPILWFLQVARWSDLTSKEKTFSVQYFAFASFKPLSRLLTAQVLAGISIAITLALPLIVRYVVLGDLAASRIILTGAILIVLLSALFGLVSQGKKLFEVVFFLVTYANINDVPMVDYFGGQTHGQNYQLILIGIVAVCAIAVYMIRKLELKRV